MRAGRLDKRIELQSRDLKPRDEYGESSAGWETFSRAWAEIRDLSGRERLASDQVKGSHTTVITLYRRKDLTVKHRVKFGSRILDINAIVGVDDRKADMQLLCTESA